MLQDPLVPSATVLSRASQGWRGPGAILSKPLKGIRKQAGREVTCLGSQHSSHYTALLRHGLLPPCSYEQSGKTPILAPGETGRKAGLAQRCSDLALSVWILLHVRAGEELGLLWVRRGEGDTGGQLLWEGRHRKPLGRTLELVPSLGLLPCTQRGPLSPPRVISFPHCHLPTVSHMVKVMASSGGDTLHHLVFSSPFLPF